MRRSNSSVPSKPKFGFGFKKSVGITSGALVTTLTIAEKAVDGIPAPGLKAAVGGLLEIIKTAKKTHENTEDLNELDAHLMDFSELLTSISGKKATQTTPDLDHRIEKLTSEIETTVEACGKLRSQGSVRNFFTTYDNASAISGINRSIERAIAMFQVGGILAIEQGITRIEQRQEHIIAHQVSQDPNDPLNLLRLHTADARYDSSSRAKASRCFEGTRSDLLQTIYTWAEDDNARPIYWLCGLAGTGKSTIAQTIAGAFDERQLLGASFFFSRDVAEQSNALMVFTTLAYQLAYFHKSFYSHIAASLKDHPGACTAMLQTQMKKLISTPLRGITDGPSTVVIVIDALDECSDEQLVQEMLVLLASAIPELPFHTKVFITSRPDIHIRSKFHEPAMQRVSEASHLHDIDISVVQHDIGLYLGHHLQKIGLDMLKDSSWPTQEDLSVLIERARGLFIYASSLIAYLGDKGHIPPKERLRSLLLDESIGDKSPYAEVDRLYSHILHASLPKMGARSFSRQLQPILGAVVLLFDPLPSSGIEKLLSIADGSIIPMLNPLHAVVSLPDSLNQPIRVFHKSFPDFMIDPKRCADNRLFIEPQTQHTQLALQCLTHMNIGLRRNICNTRDPFVQNVDIPGLEELLRAEVGLHLLYACRFWALHLEMACHKDQQLCDAVYLFVTTRLLHWLEVLSLSQHLDSAMTSLRIAQNWYPENESKRLMWMQKMIPMSEQFGVLTQQLRAAESKLLKTKTPIKALLHDCQRLILRFGEPILRSGSQIYYSALPFLPRCLLYQQFKYEAKNSVDFLQQEDNWDPTLTIYQGHSTSVSSVCFSPDGSKIASGSSDDTVRLWDTTTGVHIKTFTGHSSSVTSVCFSPDGSKIASGSYDHTVRLWDTTTGVHIKTFTGHSKSVTSVCFSPDGSKIASGSSDDTVRLWDTTTGVHIKTFTGHSSSVTSVCFSPDGSKIASGSYDDTVRLWDTTTGVHIKTFTGHSGPTWFSTGEFSDDESSNQQDTTQQDKFTLVKAREHIAKNPTGYILSQIDGVSGHMVLNGRSIHFLTPGGFVHQLCVLPFPDISCHAFFGQKLVIGTNGGHVWTLDFSAVVSLAH